MTNSKWDFCNSSKPSAYKARGAKRNVSVLEGLHCVYGKQSMGDRVNDVLNPKPPVLDILNTRSPLD